MSERAHIKFECVIPVMCDLVVEIDPDDPDSTATIIKAQVSTVASTSVSAVRENMTDEQWFALDDTARAAIAKAKGGAG